MYKCKLCGNDFDNTKDKWCPICAPKHNKEMKLHERSPEEVQLMKEVANLTKLNKYYSTILDRIVGFSSFKDLWQLQKILNDEELCNKLRYILGEVA